MAKEKGNEQKKYDLEERLVDFAVRVINLAERFPKSYVGIHIASQLVRCGTSPAANYGEAQSSESRSDFIHKMKLVLKELRETRVWLLIVERKALVKSADELMSLLVENNELISIFVTSIATAQKRR
jgi:four helix bundle protein